MRANHCKFLLLSTALLACLLMAQRNPPRGPAQKSPVSPRSLKASATRTPTPYSLLSLNTSGCSSVGVRKEYRQMTASDWAIFHDALYALTEMPSPDEDTTKNELDWWTSVHLANVKDAHFTPMFFPWHRVYLRLLEQRLQDIDDRVAIPYWVRCLLANQCACPTLAPPPL